MPTVSVSAQIEILASPSVVRSKFLEFEQSKQWQKSWTIDLTEPGKQPTELVAGDVVKVNMQGMTFRPIIAVRFMVFQPYQLASLTQLPSEQHSRILCLGGQSTFPFHWEALL